LSGLGCAQAAQKNKTSFLMSHFGGEAAGKLHEVLNEEYGAKTEMLVRYFRNLNSRKFSNVNIIISDRNNTLTFIILHHLSKSTYCFMKNTLIALLAIFLVSVAEPLFAQENMWKVLSKITYKKEYDEMLGYKVDMPVFSQEVQKLDGKLITIKGYIIPVEGYKSHKEFIFSAYPYNMCFFCGGAGPETVMEVQAKSAVPFTADPITLKGTLRLNATDINKLMYSLSNVEKVN
jgi:hypothetical protein